MELEKPAFCFATDQFGVDSGVLFHAESWPVALAQFIKFMRGAGYYIEPDKILIKEGEMVVPAEIFAESYE